MLGNHRLPASPGSQKPRQARVLVFIVNSKDCTRQEHTRHACDPCVQPGCTRPSGATSCPQHTHRGQHPGPRDDHTLHTSGKLHTHARVLSTPRRARALQEHGCPAPHARPGRPGPPTSRAGTVVERQRGLAGRQAAQHVGALGHGAGRVVVHLLRGDVVVDDCLAVLQRRRVGVAADEVRRVQVRVGGAGGQVPGQVIGGSCRARGARSGEAARTLARGCPHPPRPDSFSPERPHETELGCRNRHLLPKTLEGPLMVTTSGLKLSHTWGVRLARHQDT